MYAQYFAKLSEEQMAKFKEYHPNFHEQLYVGLRFKELHVY
ncbi:hypothetical protein GQ41_2207 [Arenibacter algicola]|uniref:Uncharacterized protein n=1 Tax=Arenibacter algicola TaxID=616991 RepID=A0ABY3AAJ9_9FLAO